MEGVSSVRGKAAGVKALRYLSEAAFSQDHDEVKIGQLDAILVAVGVVFGDVVGRRAVGVLLARTDPGSLRGTRENKNKTLQDASASGKTTDLSARAPPGGAYTHCNVLKWDR